MRTIKEIIERKKQGIDCSEEESAEIKGFLKECNPIETDAKRLKKQILKHLPIESSEALDELMKKDELMLRTRFYLTLERITINLKR